MSECEKYHISSRSELIKIASEMCLHTLSEHPEDYGLKRLPTKVVRRIRLHNEYMIRLALQIRSIADKEYK